ncbi:MAG: DUF5131 family protein [Ginsengibacter sp.]
MRNNLFFGEITVSGTQARPTHELWVWDIKQHYQEQEVAFFIKKWDGVNKKKAGRELDGITYNEMPVECHFGFSRMVFYKIFSIIFFYE